MAETIITNSAGGIVISSKGKVLVVNQHGTSWSLPKGHIEEGEDPFTAAKREIHEESGVKDLELIEDLGTYQRYRISKKGNEDISELKIIHIYLFKTNQIDLKPIDPENPEAVWVDKYYVVNYLTHQKDREFFLSVIDKIK